MNAQALRFNVAQDSEALNEGIASAGHSLICINYEM